MERNENGQIKKGTVLNPNGRPKGAKNKVQAEVKNRLQLIIENNIQRIESDLEELDAKDRLNVLIRLLEYIIPKEKEMKIDFSSLTDQEIDELIKRITDEANREN